MTTEAVKANRFAPPSTTNLVTQGTPAQNTLFAALNEAIRVDPAFRGCTIDHEKKIARVGNHAENGAEKNFFIDIVLTDPRSGVKIAIEVFGEKSSATDEERENFLKTEGFMFYPVSNHQAKDHSNEVVRHIRRSLKVIRELFA